MDKWKKTIMHMGAYPAALGKWVLLGGIFMLTDYSTSPATEWGKVVFALGAGIITMLIRNSSGGYPEGVSFAILLMNIICPHLNKIGAKKPFGVGGAEK